MVPITKAIIPAAGQGTRLFPQTHTKPKAMVRVAGKPILGHILDRVAPTDVTDVSIIVGSMEDQIIQYAQEHYDERFELSFPEQRTAEGLGHSIFQARETVGESPVMIALGDMLFETGYSLFIDQYRDLPASDGGIGVKQVDNPQHYGVVDVADGRIVGLIEKPTNPPSSYAISGVYIIEDSGSLFSALEYIIKNDVRGTDGEYQLTDALHRMVQRGSTLRTFEVQDWYDCGRPETLLEANRVMLDRLNGEVSTRDGSTVIQPTDIGTGVTLDGSVIGPHVTVDDDATIRHSVIRDSIVGQGAMLDGVNIESSIIGDNAIVEGEANRLNVGDNSEIRL